MSLEQRIRMTACKLVGILGLTGSIALGAWYGTKEPEKIISIQQPAHSVQVVDLNNISFDDAYTNPSLRQRYIEQTAERLNINPKKARVVYDEEMKPGLEYQLALVPPITMRLTNESDTPDVELTTKEPIREERERQYRQNTLTNLMVTPWDIRKYGSDEVIPIFIRASAFEECAHTGTEKQKRVLFESALRHEKKHVTDSQDGIYVNGRRLSDREQKILAFMKILRDVREVRGLAEQLTYQQSNLGITRDNEVQSYRRHINSIERTMKEKREFMEKTQTTIIVKPIVDIFLREHYDDALLGRHIRN